MNQMKNISRLFVLLFCLFQSSAFAGIVVGNGGFGVVVDGKLYLQDFVEAGLHLDPVISRHPSQDPHIKRAIEQSLSGIGATAELKDLIASKLDDLKAVDPFLAYSITSALEKYGWRLVTVPLNDSNDSEGVIDGGKTEYKQLALRLGKLIRIQKNNWDQLNTENQVGLIFHEMLYALMNMDSNISKAENSQKVRDLMGYLFSADFYNRSFLGLKTATGSYWALGNGEPATIFDGVVVTAFKFRYFGLNIENLAGVNKDLSFSEKWNFQEQKIERVARVCHNFENLDLSYARFTFGYTIYDLQFVETADSSSEASKTELRYSIRPDRRVEVLPEGFAASDCAAKVGEMVGLAEAFFPTPY